MSKAGEMILEGLAEALAYVNGDKTGVRETVVMVDVPQRIDVRAIRKKLHMSRQVFSAKLASASDRSRNGSAASVSLRGPRAPISLS
jgi:DNA-binding transcriptional regulator YiaG